MIMTNKDNTRHILLKHFEEYPELELQDVFKLLHQSSFGCEHMISSPEAAVSYLREEFNSVPRDASPKCEPLDGDYSRVHLGYLNVGLSADTLAGLFFLSAKAEPDGKESLKVKLDIVGEMIDEGLLPFDKNEFLSASKVWEADGFPPLHHSETFRRTYKPAYRVISNDYVPFLPLLAKLDAALKHGPVRLAVEGGSASGKTTLSGYLRGYTTARCSTWTTFSCVLNRERRKDLLSPAATWIVKDFMKRCLSPSTAARTSRTVPSIARALRWQSLSPYIQRG